MVNIIIQVETCTLHFRPYEFIINTNNRSYGYEIDVWSTGCIIGQILGGECLFQGTSSDEVIKDMCKKLGTPKNVNKNYQYIGFPDLEEKYPKELELIYKMLKYDIKERISMAEALLYWDTHIIS